VSTATQKPASKDHKREAWATVSVNPGISKNSAFTRWTAHTNASDVTRIATEAAHELSPRLQVVGVMFGQRSGDYTEILIDIEGCQNEPCRVSVGVFRNATESELHDEIAENLQRRVKIQL
jgi:hypothetical protein